MPKELTDADVMTGFNPDYHASAADLEARQDEGADAITPGPEGEGGDTANTERSDAPAAPAERSVTLDGKTYKAPAEIADAFTREINRRDGTRGAEMQTLRERLARLEGANTTAQPDAKKDEGPPLPDPELQIENPAAYQEQLLARINYQQDQRDRRLAAEYETAEAGKEREKERRAAWENHVEAFYNDPDNAVLKDNRDIVDKVLEQNAAALAPLDVAEGFKELGRLSKERLARITGQAPAIRARTTPKPANLEGSSRRDVAAAGDRAGKDTGPKSLTAALKERRRAAAASFAKGSQAPASAR